MSNSASQDGKCPKCGTPLAANTTEGLCPACLLALNLMTQTQLTGEETGPHDSKKAQLPPKAPPTPHEIAQFFPQFEILECLGRGGMGVVYRARQKSLNRLVALKILAPEREKDAAFSQRFAAEAEILAKLNHPSIITVHDFGETRGMFYLVMEFVDGVNLRHLLKERKLSPEEALAIVPPVCEALQYAHSQGVIHRDIKPENLLLDKQGRIKIADFGIAKILGRTGKDDPQASSAGVPEATQVIGTPQYMAPEQTSDPQMVDHRADIYSLGVVLYEMLTGELPASKLQPPSRKVQVDVRIDEIVLRALEKEPEQRYQTAQQFKTMVETISSTGASETQPKAPPSEPGSPPLPPAIPNSTRQVVKWSATCLLVSVLFSPFLPGIAIAAGTLKAGSWMLIPLIFVIIATTVAGIGAWKMRELESYRWALAGAITAVPLSFFNFFCLPFAVWALVVLTRPNVRKAFGVDSVHKQTAPIGAAGGPLPAGSKARSWFFATGAVFPIKNIALQPRAKPMGDGEAITAVFGPVIERDLVGSESLTNCFLDADTGRVLSASKELLESLRAQGQLGPSLPHAMFISDWARTNGVDFMLRSGESRLLLLEGITLESSRRWDAHRASEVMRLPDSRGELPSLVKPGSQMACDFDPADPETRTWVFRTREGSCGVLQVIGFTNNPLGIKVRYKLVQ